tara:strand:+ start:41 stop:667 length:627 start_codon:yes stop_codon:yes gene_type:complete
MAKRTYNRRGRQTAKTPVTSSKRRPQRIKGAQTARRTGSKDKMTVSGQRNIKGGPRGAQGPANPPVQGPSRRTPTAIGGDTGRRGGPNQPARSGPPRPAGPKASRVGSQIRTAAKVGTLVNPRSDLPAKAIAAASLAMDAAKALRGKPSAKKGTGKPMASMGKDYKAKEKEAGRKAIASNFDQAFAKARKAGKKTFTWRGKLYTTKMK